MEKLSDGAIKIHQTRYIEDIMAKFLPDDKKKANVPYITTVKLSKGMGPLTEEAIEEMKKIPYRSLIGALNHLANYTRPDIAAAVGICAQFSCNPGMQHWRSVLQIVRYLKDTKGMGVIYGRKRTKMIPYVPLLAYADSSWADNLDDRTSRSGIMLWSWGGPIEWQSKKQKSQALSTTEAEYMAACRATKSIVWARRLFEDFGYKDLGIFDPTEPLTEEERKGKYRQLYMKTTQGVFAGAGIQFNTTDRNIWICNITLFVLK